MAKIDYERIIRQWEAKLVDPRERLNYEERRQGPESVLFLLRELAAGKMKLGEAVRRNRQIYFQLPSVNRCYELALLVMIYGGPGYIHSIPMKFRKAELCWAAIKNNPELMVGFSSEIPDKVFTEDMFLYLLVYGSPSIWSNSGGSRAISGFKTDDKVHEFALKAIDEVNRIDKTGRLQAELIEQFSENLKNTISKQLLLREVKRCSLEQLLTHSDPIIREITTYILGEAKK